MCNLVIQIVCFIANFIIFDRFKAFVKTKLAVLEERLSVHNYNSEPRE